LDDHYDYPKFKLPGGWIPLGQSALLWATMGIANEDPGVNTNRWRVARATFNNSFRQTTKAEREAYLAQSMLNLGCVVHLLEDMGVPAHTRNDFVWGHYRNLLNSGNPLENWTEAQISTDNEIPDLFLTGWTPQPIIFSKIADYWDAGMEPSVPSTVSPSNDWGLAECTNYQFLSDYTVFRPNVNNTKYYFPNPAFSNLLPDFYEGEGIFRCRYATGYGVIHLAACLYTEKYNPAPICYTVTDNYFVYRDYASITIPRTIDYTTGLVNYFFRGILEVEAHSTGGSSAEITITNKSMNSTVEQALNGGTFWLYAYTHDGEAVPVEVSLSGGNNGILLYNEQMTGTFNIPSTSSPIMYYGVVYIGQIVPNSNPELLDTDDPQAVAYGRTASKTVLYFTNCATLYLDNPTQYDEELEQFTTSYRDVKAGFYYTPMQWVPIPETCEHCCNNDNPLTNIIPDGYTFPPEIYYEVITWPIISTDIDTFVYNLMAGALPEYVIIAHQDRSSMFNTEEDWNLWFDRTIPPTYDDTSHPWPGVDDPPIYTPGILYDPLTTWWSELPENDVGYAIYRAGPDNWIHHIMNAVDVTLENYQE